MCGDVLLSNEDSRSNSGNLARRRWRSSLDGELGASRHSHFRGDGRSHRHCCIRFADQVRSQESVSRYRLLDSNLFTKSVQV